MTGTETYPQPVPDVRRAWTVGGVLLIVSAVIGVAISPFATWMLPVNLLGELLFGAALLVFAFGLGGAGSVTARRPLGTIALVVLVAWIILSRLAQPLIFANDAGTPGVVAFSIADLAVQLATTLIAVVQIARAGVVPAPWQWAPLWAFLAVLLPGIIGLVVGRLSDSGPQELYLAIAGLDSLARTAAPIFLGVLALVLANHSTRLPRRPGVPSPSA